MAVKINGRKLAWSIIHLIFFISFFFVSSSSLLDSIANVALAIFFAWRFISNMGAAFE